MRHLFIRSIVATTVLAAACGAGAQDADVQLAAAEPTAPLAAPALDAAPADATSAPVRLVQLAFNSGRHQPGYERLRVVRREHTQNNVARQLALNVGLAVLTGGASFAFTGFSKDDLAGTPVVELGDDPIAANPAMTELRAQLGPLATDIYQRRARQLQENAAPAELPAFAKAELSPGDWHLVYENLAGQDALYRLKFSAQLGTGGLLRKPASCAYASEPLDWAAWQADGWQALRVERDKAVAHCVQALAATPEQHW